MSWNFSGMCILQVIKLCDWVTPMDMFVGILMDSMGFMEGML